MKRLANIAHFLKLRIAILFWPIFLQFDSPLLKNFPIFDACFWVIFGYSLE